MHEAKALRRRATLTHISLVNGSRRLSTERMTIKQQGVTTMASKVIASGNITDQALVWLTAHQATFENTLALSLISLPETAMVEKGTPGQSWEYTVSFYDQDGNYEDEYAVVELDIDAYETRIYLKKQ
jgi:hypothetical protein